MDSPKTLAKHRGTRIALVAGLVILGVMVSNTVIHYWNIRRLGETSDNIQRSSDKLRAANQVFIAMQEAETSQLGYLVTGNRSYLDPFLKAADIINDRITQLGELVKESPEQLAAVASLKVPLDIKLDAIKQSLVIHDRDGPEAAREFIRGSMGKYEVNSLRGLLTQFQIDERETQAELISLSDASTFNTVWFSLIAAVTGIGVLGLIYYYLRRELLIREQFSKYLMDQDKIKSNFLAILGHELRNPLAAIRNSVDVLYLNNDKLPPQVEEIRAIIQRQTEVMIRLADDLMDTSRMTYSKLQIKLQPLNFREFMQRLIGDARTTHHETNITLDFVCPEQPMWVDGDQARLNQVVNNLLQNAVKFSRSGQTIRCELSLPDPKTVQLCIRDHGMGIAPDKLEEIFQPFMQARRSDRIAGGLGLGLALVRGFVQLHGGTINAESEGPQKGSMFTLRLPCIPEPAQASQEIVEACPPSDRHCIIVIIDDRRDASYPLKRILEHMGHKVYVATDGTRGIELAREHEPDVVLCDIGLPGISGMDVARELRIYPETHDLYLVAVTGHSAEELREESQLAGFDAFMTKPVSREGLHKIISALPCHV